MLLDFSGSAFYSCSMKVFVRLCCCVYALVFLLLVVGCDRNAASGSFERDTLFVLNYGGFEDELDIFDIGSQVDVNTHMKMKDGFFFIANGKAQKVLQLSSYGDLISVYYNPETNSVPSFVNPESITASKYVSQQAVAYPFNAPGHVAVDTKKNLYVVDQLPPERQEHDPAQKLLLRQVVLRFSNDGTLIDYLGQQGPGGTPFPYITGLHTTKNNELVVVSVTGTGMLANWFTPDGLLKYSVPVQTAELPNPFDSQSNMYVSLETIVPDYSGQTLYLKIDYYTSEIDTSSNVESGIRYTATMIYPLDMRTGLYDEPINVPPYEESFADDAGQKAFESPYQLLGVTENGWFFCISPDPVGYALQILRSDGQKIVSRKLEIGANEMLLNDISLSSDGIVSALLGGEYAASVVWWRTDSILANFSL